MNVVYLSETLRQASGLFLADAGRCVAEKIM